MATANGKDGGRNRARTAIVLSGLTGTAFFLAGGTTQLIAAATLDPLLVSAPAAPPSDVVAATARRNRVADGDGCRPVHDPMTPNAGAGRAGLGGRRGAHGDASFALELAAGRGTAPP